DNLRLCQVLASPPYPENRSICNNMERPNFPSFSLENTIFTPGFLLRLVNTPRQLPLFNLPLPNMDYAIISAINHVAKRIQSNSVVAPFPSFISHPCRFVCQWISDE
ncbi:hypothetical protein PIB30_099980, partial [Stylosanthes scabra]|nr:hypothetical protein [Stylosanthes scabra]